MPAPLLPDAEPFSADGGPHGALVLHGITGNPSSMKGVARALAAAGFAVDCPLLPGHGTTVDDLLDVTWADWSAAAEDALTALAARLDEGGRLVVVGLSMGGTLTAWLASRHPTLAGIALVNPLVEPAPDLRALVAGTVADGTEVFPSIGSDIAKPAVLESTSEGGTPLRALLTLLDAVADLQPGLAAITCPVLLLSSVEDHVVPPSNGAHLVATVTAPLERVMLERSYHVATLDFDAELIEERVVDFAVNMVGSGRRGS
ncbi:MAG: alpha/beta fold hydrolase [Acidimicrobiales bacterium]